MGRQGAAHVPADLVDATSDQLAVSLKLRLWKLARENERKEIFSRALGCQWVMGMTLCPLVPVDSRLRAPPFDEDQQGEVMSHYRDRRMPV